MTKHLPWFRFYTEAIDDEKLGLLAFEDRWHFVALLCLKGKGVLDDEPDAEMLARKVALKMGLTLAELAEVMRRLEAVGLACSATYQPSMHLVVAREDMRPHATVWRVIRERIFRRDDYTCAYCGVRGVSLECDHVVPVARGGGHEDENLTTACRACNRSKRDKLVSEWRPA